MASENELKWLDRYLETGDAKQAIRDIFPDCQEKNVASRASHLKSKLEAEIDQRFTKVIKRDSIKAFRIISDLMQNAKTEAIKYKAASDILNRAGYNEITRFEDVTKSESYPELVRTLKAALSGLDGELLAEILDNTDDIKNIQLLTLGQVGTEQ